ncbi:MAG: sulfur carrier protein ThiS [Deltaproteobacteria bacterium]|nr:sulfur carrier protein ThiS [Deltaproteobacteria bacterium]
MEITVNGEKRTGLTSPLTIAELLEQLGINPKSIIVELNFEIVTKNKVNETIVRDGDTIEIIRLVGGG